MPTHDDYTLFHGDCFEYLRGLPDASVDLVLTDPPYGVTNNAWDVKPDIPQYFREAWRVLKPKGVFVCFGTFKSALDWVLEAREFFRYDLVWNKCNPAGFLDANRKPLRVHEMILIFYREAPEFHPQFTKGQPYKKPENKQSTNYGNYDPQKSNNPTGDRYPLSIVKIRTTPRTDCFHPTQKPVELMEWLVKTYTSPGETVLDPFMGSGSTGVACIQTGRKFIGCELDPHFFDVAQNRLKTAVDNFQYNLFEETGENDG